MNNRKYWVLGLVGCACFGIGDWLLGFVNPEMVNSAFSVLKAGHGVGYDLSKITWTLLAGALGVPMMLAGCNHMAELATDALWKRILRFSMLLLPVGWLLIHFTVSCGIYAYAWNAQYSDVAHAESMALAIMSMFRSTQIAAYLFAGIPLILLPVCVLRGKMTLMRRSQWFTPLLWIAVFAALKFVLPATPFTNGLDTFCMNAGMMIWFGYLLLKAA